MRKAIIAFFLLISFHFITYSQIKVAIVAGGHQSTVNEENSLPDWQTTKNYYSGRIGFHGGFLADIPFSQTSKLYFQPGVIFFNKGRKFSQNFDTTSSTIIQQKSTQHVNYIDLPLNLVLKFGDKTKFIIGGGPYGSFFYNGKETSQTYTQSGISQSDENDDLPVGKNPGQYQTFNYGVNALAGFEFGKAFLTVNYSLGLSDFYQAKDYDGTFRHQVLGATLGIFLGQPVKIEKKIKDQDQDGIPDDKDACPTEKGSVLNNGCPDRDGDGIADIDDKCPDQPGKKINNGCPDADGDGIADKDDKCPDISGLIRYNGCPVPDSDKDGIDDENDKCPQVAGYARYGGCPIPDRDGDNVNDEEDKCPDVKGKIENNGCPVEIKKEVVEKVNIAAKRIQFNTAKATLLPASFRVLDDVVNLLNENPGLNVLIEGHTSSEGSLTRNMELSIERANTVKDFLISKGIDKSRLTTKGLGPTQPLTTEKTEADRAQNRRVELKLSN
jgi:outer membrane protein OmpA-like peptidoglycan-associated protein